MWPHFQDRTTRAHKLTVEALWHVMWPHFQDRTTRAHKLTVEALWHVMWPHFQDRTTRPHKLTVEALWHVMWPHFQDRTTRPHKLTMETLWHTMRPYFQAWAQQRGHGEQEQQRQSEAVSVDDHGDPEQPSIVSGALNKLEEAVEDEHLLQQLEHCNKTLSPTGLYWRNCMKMVLILLQLIYAECWRSTNQMHKAVYLAMLLWFAHYGDTNCTCGGTKVIFSLIIIILFILSQTINNVSINC